jgi:UDP-galactopyranose mutase
MYIVKNLVVGAGLSGCILAQRLASSGEKVLVIDQNDFIGGACHDFKMDGITVHKFGPHCFHTNKKAVWDYLSQFTEWHPFMLKVHAVIEGNYVPIPFNINSIEKVFPKNYANKMIDTLIRTYDYGQRVPILELLESDDPDIKFLSEYIYKNVFEGYTTKQWGVQPSEVNKNVLNRVPIVISRNDCYFDDKYQGIPADGYTAMMEKMLAHENIDTLLGVSFNDEVFKYERLFYTGSIDELYNYQYGELKYRSCEYKFVKYDKSYKHITAYVNYPCNYDFTRHIEHKHFLDEQSPHTIISYEYPADYDSSRNSRFYPVENEINVTLYNKYKSLASEDKRIIVLGRLGKYKYFNMDAIVADALEISI